MRRERGVDKYTLGILQGDGIGPEVVPAAADVFSAAARRAGVKIEWRDLPMGHKGLELFGDAMPSSTKDELSRCHGWIMGPHDSLSYPQEWYALHRPLPTGEIRRDFDLFAIIRPFTTFGANLGAEKEMDLVLVRESTEGFYADRNMLAGPGEWMPTKDVAIAVGVFTPMKIRRILETGFELARDRRRHLTVVHKGNVLRLTSGMYERIAVELAKDYPDIEVDFQFMDAMTAHLVRNPGQFDVIVTENMFGDILADLMSALAGGLGLGPGLNAGSQQAMAQAAHGSAPDIAGKDKANPVGEIISAAMLARWLGHHYADAAMAEIADVIEYAVRATLSSGMRTVDVGGTSGTREVTTAIIDVISGGNG
jgi:3-isopropylmalate dehydrogenase